MPTDVRCTVSDCQFWANGNYCAANSILITHGQPHTRGEGSAGPPADKFGQDSPNMASTPIENIEDSYCYTFIKKGGGPQTSTRM
jgi:hypothetical protein